MPTLVPPAAPPASLPGGGRHACCSTSSTTAGTSACVSESHQFMNHVSPPRQRTYSPDCMILSYRCTCRVQRREHFCATSSGTRNSKPDGPRHSRAHAATSPTIACGSVPGVSSSTRVERTQRWLKMSQSSANVAWWS
eukprot:6051987-Prymnesium_polylepis.1